MVIEKQADPTTITIVFRGLMVAHHDKKNRVYEVGILPSPGHVFRISAVTLKEGQDLNDDLKGEQDLNDERNVLHRFDHPEEFARQIWRLDSASVTAPGVGPIPSGLIDRLSEKTDPRDFRWIVDLESEEFYPTGVRITPGKLKPILRISSGQLSTRNLSDVLKRRQGAGTFMSFGKISEDTALEIEGGAVLLDGTGKEIFKFEGKPKTIYGILNTPFLDATRPGHAHLVNEDEEAAPDEHAHHSDVVLDTRPDPVLEGENEEEDHFQLYYDVFRMNEGRKFKFRLRDSGKPGRPTGPSPNRCGLVFLSKRTKSLT